MATASLSPGEIRQPQVSDKAEFNIPRAHAYFWFVVIWLIYLLDIADRAVLSAVLPAFKEQWGLSDTQVGIVAIPMTLMLAVLVIPAGAFVDKWSRKGMISIMVTIWSLGSWSRAWATNMNHLLLSHLFLGAGEAGYNPAGYALIGAWFPQKLRGTMVGLFNSAQALGAFGGMALAGFIMVNWGWQHVFGVLAIPGLVLAGLILFAPDYKAKKVGVAEAAVKVSYGEVLRFIGRSRTVLMLYAFQFTIAIWAAVFGGWVAFFFIRYFQQDIATAAYIAGIVGLLACLGAPTFGWLSDKLSIRYVNGRILGAIIAVIGYTLFWTISLGTGMVQGPLVIGVLGWALGNFCMAGQWGTVVAAVMDLMPPPYRGTGQSFIPVGLYLMASIMGVIVGAMSDQMGLVNALMICVWVSAVPSMIMLVASARTYAADLAKTKALGEFKLAGA
ncbi:MAG: MFS transporter [Chloroflexota bacterium]